MDPLSLLALFGPVVVEGLKGAISRWIAPENFKPATIEQYTAMVKLEIERFTALANAGGTNLPTLPWVDAAVKLMRPAAATVVLATWSFIYIADSLSAGQLLTETAMMNLNSLVAAVMFYLFGDVTLHYAKRAELRK